MQPSESFKKISHLVNMCAKACGANVFSPDFRVNYFTVFVLICVVGFYISSGYTAYVKMREGFAAVLGSLCMVGKGTQGLCKLLTALILRKQFFEVDQFLANVYVEYEVRGQMYMEALHLCIKRIHMLLKVLACAYLVSCPLAMIIPLALWLYDGRHTLPMVILIPGFDVDTHHGYVVTVTVQCTFFALGAFGNFAGDLFFFLVLSHFGMLVDILKIKIGNLNELSVDPYSPNCLEALLDVLEWHQTFSKFTEDTDHIFYWINFTQIFTSGMSLIMILVVIMSGDWINAYTYICLEFSMMFMYCLMGTVVEVANDNIMMEIYAIHWYNLTVDQQKIVKLMLMKSQTPKELTIGGIMPLSVNTGLQVTKTVYSVFMMLLNLFAE